MGDDQFVVGWLLVGVLLAVALYYGWRQVWLLRQPRNADDPDADAAEALYRHNQIRRRLINSGLMLVLAAQMAGAMVYTEIRAQRQAERADARERGEVQAPPTAEERSFLQFYGVYWLIFLLILLAVVTLAFSDWLSTRRFALRAHRQLQAQRREMIDREIARLRQEKQQRNGHN